MKFGKILGLAVVLAMALMAFAGAATASATVLCKTAAVPPENCVSSGWGYKENTPIKASFEEGTGVTFRVNGETISACVESEYEAKTTTTGSEKEAVKGNVGKWTLGICSPNATTVVEPGTFKIEWQNGSLNGDFIGIEYKISMVISGIKCVYGPSAENMGTLTGGAMGTIDVHTGMARKEGGFLCPTTMVMEASYTVTSPEPLYVSKS